MKAMTKKCNHEWMENGGIITCLKCNEFRQGKYIGQLKCPKCDDAEIKPEDLSAMEVLNVLERFADQYGYSKFGTPSLPSEEEIAKTIYESDMGNMKWSDAGVLSKNGCRKIAKAIKALEGK